MLSSKSRASATRPSLWHELVVLFKLRIVVLLLLAALAGQFVAAGGWPGWQAMAAFDRSRRQRSRRRIRAQ